MSSDNYYYVRKEGGKYYVTHHFMSDEWEDGFVPAGGVEFDSFEDAYYYAANEYSEYGVLLDSNVEYGNA